MLTGHSVKLLLALGQDHDSQPPTCWRICRKATLLTDEAYDNDTIRKSAEDRKGWANIPARPQPQKLFHVLQTVLPL